MMNKSKIDWCDFSWNPVTGCRHTCEYCYARKQARRFSGDVRINKASEQIEFGAPKNLYTLEKPFKNANGKVIPCPAGFEPTLHEYRLDMPSQKKKPANIFICSMADLFGEWVPDEWITKVFDACKAAPWHNYLFLTKNPQRYEELADNELLPTDDNMWYGTSATTPDTSIFHSSRHKTFVSVEPILKPFKDGYYNQTDWIIVGAETGNRQGKVTPRREWIEEIIAGAKYKGTPILMKHSAELEKIWGEDLIQEFPEKLNHPEDTPIPHCKECEHHKEVERHYNSVHDKTVMTHVCKLSIPLHKKIPGRYVRTSPPWCPKRKETKK